MCSQLGVCEQRGDVGVYLRVVCDVQSYVFTVADVAMFDDRTRSLSANTHGGTH